MIQLSFIGPQRKIIKFKIEDRIIYYFDDNWKSGLQVMPKNEKIILKIKRSGNQNLKVILALILDCNDGENLKQYNLCKTEEDLAELVRNDSKMRGLIEIK